MRKLLPIVLVLFTAQAFSKPGSKLRIPKTPTDLEKTLPAALRKKAEAGDADAQLSLGLILEEVRGTPNDWSLLMQEPDFKAAAKWHKKAAEQGDVTAQFHLAQLHHSGRLGTPLFVSSDVTAAKWYKKAAEQGHLEAQLRLADLLDHGSPGNRKNQKEALIWYLKAAEQGSAAAQFAIGCMHLRGFGTAMDLPQALEWWGKAAEQRHARAMFFLGKAYLFGLGVLQDFVNSYAWFNLSAYHGDADAHAYREKLVLKMTPEQIAKAQELSKELLKKIEANKAAKE